MVRKNSLNLLTSSTITTPLSKSNMKCIRYKWTSWTRQCSWNNWIKIWKKISTKVYFKPTDCHALLHKSSYHPKHTFKGIIKSQIIRFYRISSKESDLQDSISVLFRSLRKRGYSSRFLRAIKSSTLAGLNPNIMNIGEVSNDSGGNRTQNQVELGEPNRLMPLVTTYSRSYLPLHHQLKTNFKKHTSGLTRFQNCRVISAHRRNKNLRDMLVRAKLPEQMRRIRSAKPDHWAFKLRRFCVQSSWKNRGTHSAENDP